MFGFFGVVIFATSFLGVMIFGFSGISLFDIISQKTVNRLSPCTLVQPLNLFSLMKRTMNCQLILQRQVNQMTFHSFGTVVSHNRN